MKNTINFIFLLAVLLLIERLSYSVPQVFCFWFGMFSGVVFYGAYDLVYIEIKKYFE